MVQGELKSKTVFFRNDVKNYTEFRTDCKNFQLFSINQKLNVEVCDDDVMEVCDVIEKCVSCCGKVWVSCVRAVLWMCGQLIASTSRLKALGC